VTLHPGRTAAFAAVFLCLAAAGRADTVKMRSGEETEAAYLDGNSEEAFLEKDGVIRNVPLGDIERIAGAEGERLLHRDFSVAELLKNLERLKESFAKSGRTPTAEEKEIVDEAQVILHRATENGGPAEGESAEKTFGRYQSDKHEKFVAALERYLAEFAEKARGADSATTKALLPYVDSLREYIRSYLAKLGHMHDAIAVARRASGLPVEEKKT
jgi:hypothetical protein